MTAKERALRVIATGTTEGELGHTLVYGTNVPGIAVLGFSRGGMDAGDLEHCRQVVKRYQPDVIIHCDTERETDAAPSQVCNVALAAREFGAKLVYVVDGASALTERQQLQSTLERLYIVNLSKEPQSLDELKELSTYILNLIQTDRFGFYELYDNGVSSYYQFFKQEGTWKSTV
ncbi:RmlD substrate binding domain-containing protein [Paenibacillus taihuensis]|uniref:RmlD substrate binding domain-containing protein n=1 Tax=Paenibacillus taihuensis TaxID=1156355 RepID=A0A3D9SB46_9BACL|nr:sugar nucleotide-binding protein [Paenibacillus taihuensis]REE90510.1 RmlD substrate binding domain-containing protein [Paenibacillus taihuensis]